MKIIKLSSENVKRLVAVQVTPEGTLITVGGKNEAGKSSVLDSIAYALGGDKLVPTEPIRKGETEAKVVLDLGDYIVTRRFRRDLLNPAESDPKTESPSPKSFGPTTSTLVVTNREGAKYPSPQALLDKLYGKLTFDPLAFSKEKPDKQNEILRKLTNLDFSLLNAKRKEIYDRRAMVRKSAQIMEANLNLIPKHPNAPKEAIPLLEISAEIKHANDLREATERMIRDHERIIEDGRSLAIAHDNYVEGVSSVKSRIHSLESELKAMKEELAADEEAVKDCEERIKVQQIRQRESAESVEMAKRAVPNFEELERRLAEIDQINTMVRENNTYFLHEQQCKAKYLEVEDLDAQIGSIDIRKDEMLTAAEFPVPGLGLTDDGVTFEGLALNEVSSSVQLRVSIAIGLALNPTLKVLLIRNGNLLDEDHLKQVAEQAEAAGAQVWMEYVTSNAEGVSVMLEDGHIK